MQAFEASNCLHLLQILAQMSKELGASYSKVIASCPHYKKKEEHCLQISKFPLA